MKKAQGPGFLRFYIPLLGALRELGGSAQPAEVTDLVIEKLNITEEEQSQTVNDGTSRVRNQIAWARFYLAKAGYIDSSVRGVWSLNEKGIKVNLSEINPLDDFKKVREIYKVKSLPGEQIQTKSIEQTEESTRNNAEDYRLQVIKILRSLPSDGFERICQRLLRESGFEQVVVTGRTGDGGIDGHGVLEINPFVTFKVLFQCKRYEGSVSASQVRDFRGAMMGRADKGIIITTGSFTTDAKKEARRDGVPPIELVDSEKLIDMFEKLELGLKPRKAFDIDLEFFESFRQGIS